MGHLLQHLSQLSHLIVFNSYFGFAFSVIKTLCSELLCIGMHIRLICIKRNLPLVNHDYKNLKNKTLSFEEIKMMDSFETQPVTVSLTLSVRFNNGGVG